MSSEGGVIFVNKEDIYNANLMGVFREFGNGWNQLYNRLCDEIKPYGVKVIQAKEKYSLMRVYVEPYSEELEQIIDKYEVLSGTVCEHCGNAGKLRSDLSWVQTLCENCYNEINKGNLPKGGVMPLPLGMGI